MFGLDAQQQDAVSKVVFGLAELIDKQDAHIETLQARIVSQVKVQQGSDKILSLLKAASEAKDKALQAREEHTELDEEADKTRTGFVERFVKHLEEHKTETMSDRQRVCDLETMMQPVLDTWRQSLGRPEDTGDVDAAVKRD